MAEAHLPKGRRSGQYRRPRRVVDGLLLLDKPSGCTSNQALQQVKRLYQAGKAGHTGSLDPLATGMLPICLGQATKVSAFLLDSRKLYRVTAHIGVKTDTGDADGQVLEQQQSPALAQDRLLDALEGFRGEIEQVPPMYSALKQDGRRLYELARAGEQVHREPRRVTIDELVLEHFDPVNPVFRVRCSKGTYVRTLVEDIAQACGTLAHVAALRRLSVEPFDEALMVSMPDLEAAASHGFDALDSLLRPVDDALADWPELQLGRDDAYYLRLGNPVFGAAGRPPGRVRLYGENHHFLGIGEILRDGRIAPRRLFVPAPGAGQG
ncbi:MAG TPA: tRNA pseudouridine(55) synthase TruB [Chromatiales bacterium]|nr:tRNA pseudouridine(55) synthase TruB [Chromatiales bacterium]